MDLLPAVRTATGWHIAPDARRPYIEGSRMILKWMQEVGACERDRLDAGSDDEMLPGGGDEYATTAGEAP